MLEPVTTIDRVAVLLPALLSFVAPVVPVAVELPIAVGVPETGHTIVPPAATVAGGTGVQVPTVRPAGRPASEQVAPDAWNNGEAPAVQVKEPE